MVQDCILNIIILKRKYKHTVLWSEKNPFEVREDLRFMIQVHFCSNFDFPEPLSDLFWSANLFLFLSSSSILPLVNICWIISFPYVDEWLWFDSWRYVLFKQIEHSKKSRLLSACLAFTSSFSFSVPGKYRKVTGLRTFYHLTLHFSVNEYVVMTDFTWVTSLWNITLTVLCQQKYYFVSTVSYQAF